MYTGNAALKFDEVLSVGLTCLEQKLDSKADVKARIITAVQNQFNENVKEAKEVEDLPLGVFTLLYEKLGIGFEINDGKVMGVNINAPVMHVQTNEPRLLLEKESVCYGCGHFKDVKDAEYQVPSEDIIEGGICQMPNDIGMCFDGSKNTQRI